MSETTKPVEIEVRIPNTTVLTDLEGNTEAFESDEDGREYVQFLRGIATPSEVVNVLEGALSGESALVIEADGDRVEISAVGRASDFPTISVDGLESLEDLEDGQSEK